MAIANELKGTGVSVSVLCPGFTKTALTESLAKTSGSKVFRDNMMDAKYVAEEGYKGLMKGTTIIIPGMKNHFLQIFGKFAPRKLLTTYSRMLVERR